MNKIPKNTASLSDSQIQQLIVSNEHPVYTTGYSQITVVEGSQFYTDLEMIKRGIGLIKMRLVTPEKGYSIVDGTPTFTMTTLEEVVDSILTGIQNTINQGYKLVKDGK